MPNTYATIGRLITLIGEDQIRSLLGLDPDAEYTQDARLLACIDRANDTVDSYLRGAYTLPLAGDPASSDYYPVLCGNAVTITKWYMMESRPEVESENDRSRFKDAIQYLSDLAQGKGKLDIVDAAEVTPGPSFTAPAVVTMGGKREPIIHQEWMYK